MTRYRFGAGMSTGPGRVTWSEYPRVEARAVPRFRDELPISDLQGASANRVVGHAHRRGG